VSICRQGAPIFISFPHLLYADDRIKNSVVGIEPDESVHRTLFEVEPHTGLVLRAEKRLQINVFVATEPFIDDMKNIKDVIFPAIWINESTVIDQKSADDLKNKVLRPFAFVYGVSIGLIPFGVVLFIITVIVFRRKRRSRLHPSARHLLAESHNSIAHQDD
jgi:lysosome membrane protein 2